jgi:molybdate/tungstate transport system permease protein
VGSALAQAGVVLMGNPLGIVLAQVYVASPFVIMSSMIAFVNVDPRIEAAAALLGDSSIRVFWRVALPLAWPGIGAGLVLACMRALGEFGATIILAYNPQTLPVYLWVRFESRGLSGALPIALILVAIATVTVIVWRVLSRLSTSSGAILVAGVPEPRSR